ncbi:MAG: hypothetical protein V4574_06140 [Pseudomonadota bacterium]
MSGLLDRLISPAIREPASCQILAGPVPLPIGGLSNMVKSVEIVASRSEAATGTIVLEDRRLDEGRWAVADSGVFRRWTAVQVAALFGLRRESVFSGVVKAIEPKFASGGADTSIEIKLQDVSLLLDRTHVQRAWGDPAPQTDGMIVRELIGGAGILADEPIGEGQSGRVLQQNATAIRFIQDRARANGYELYTTREGRLYFGPMRLTGEPQAPILVLAGPDTSCISLEISDDAMRPDAVTYETAPASGTRADTATVQPDLPALGTSPASSERPDRGGDYTWRLQREGDESAETARTRAQGAADANAFKLKATGELDGAVYGHVLEVGRTVRLDGVGPRYGGRWYVDKVTHAFSGEGYRQRFELIRNATGDDGGAGGALGAFSSLLGVFG